MDYLAAAAFGAFGTLLLFKIVGVPKWLQDWYGLVER